ncbi:Translin [Sphaerosporella brunnea]|uniref:Translin n=1 Tax=Sphaerosporella brunnea TaxID=1250544 RepID=A0A5J5EYS2_9PEZI|nr:Translin [Sphaerosporella brunnea]
MADSTTPYTAIDHDIFATVQEQIERDAQVKEEIRDNLKSLDKQSKQINSMLSRVHSVPPSEVPHLVAKTKPYFENARKELHGLIETVKAYPYYKYNGLWSRDLQNLTFLVLLETWLERMYTTDTPQPGNALLTIEEVGERFEVPVNLQTEDKFHITIEEYLHAVISLVEELSRLMTNAVTQRDFKRPQLISTFVKDIHSSFQVLNLKNDSLRRRSDGLKYNVKKVEDIYYDLVVRNLIASEAPTEEHVGIKKEEDVENKMDKD